MRIRIFRAPTLAEAMRQIRDELGLDALILSTATQADAVEVTAALEPEDEPDLPGTPPLFVRPGPDTPAPARTLDPARGSASPSLLRHGLPARLLEALGHGPLEPACSRLFRFTRLPLDADARPLLLAGPPGAGKTLTIAKLATRLVMEGHRPLVITADDKRAGAIEQLAAFTRLLGLTLIAAGRPEMLERALARREALSPVLIDAPGLDLFEPAQQDLLESLAKASGSRIGLVLPAGLDPVEAGDIASSYAASGADLLVATRLDRSGRLGGVLAAAHAADLALTEAGIGTDVVNGLAQLTPSVLASRLEAAATHRPPAPIEPAFQQRQPLPEPRPTQPTTPNRGRNTLALHIAAQSGASCPPMWKNNP